MPQIVVSIKPPDPQLQPPERTGGILSRIDENILDIWTSFKYAVSSWHKNYLEGVFDGVVRHITGYSMLAYYPLLALRFLGTVAMCFKNKINFFSHGLSFIKAFTFLLAMTVVGFILNGLIACQEILGVVRQSIFYLKAVTAINKLSQDELVNRLGEDYCKAKGITAGNLQEADLDELKMQAFKKQVFHIIGLISAALFIFSTAAACLAMPPAIPLILVGVGILLWIARYFVKAGWVDNVNGGFSPFLGFPDCVRQFFQQKNEKEVFLVSSQEHPESTLQPVGSVKTFYYPYDAFAGRFHFPGKIWVNEE